MYYQLLVTTLELYVNPSDMYITTLSPISIKRTSHHCTVLTQHNKLVILFGQ